MPPSPRRALPTGIATAAGGVACLVAAAVVGIPAAHAESVTLAAGDSVVVTMRGNGHGHGMSQYGARGAAIKGLSYAAILNFYYPHTSLFTLARSTIRVRLAGTGTTTTVAAAAGMIVSGVPGVLATNGIARYRLIAGGGRGLVLQQLPSAAGSTWRTVRTGLRNGTGFVPRAGATVRVFDGNGGASTAYWGTAAALRASAVGTAGGVSTINRTSLDHFFRPADQVIVAANARAGDLYGLPRDALIGRSLQDFTTDAARGEQAVSTLLALPHDQPLDAFEFTQRRADGTRIHILARASVIDYRGHPAILTINRDITERMRAEQAVRESDVRKGAMLDAALDCIISVDHTGAIIEFNLAAEQTFGYPRSAVIGKELTAIIIPPALRASHQHGFAHYLATGCGTILNQRLELTAVRADGSEFPVELAISRVPLDGAPILLPSCAILLRISKRKQRWRRPSAAFRRWSSVARRASSSSMRHSSAHMSVPRPPPCLGIRLRNTARYGETSSFTPMTWSAWERSIAISRHSPARPPLRKRACGTRTACGAGWRSSTRIS